MGIDRSEAFSPIHPTSRCQRPTVQRPILLCLAVLARLSRPLSRGRKDSLWRIEEARPHHWAVGLIRVGLVDDADRIRSLLRDLLEDDGRFDVVGEADNGLEAIALAARTQPDAIVVDVSMPIMDGLEAVPRIRSGSPDTRVIVFSSYGEREMRERALDAGADAYLEKGKSVSLLVETLLGTCGKRSRRHRAPVVTADRI
jgi:CheY-like chemotaxis protein